MSGDIDVVNIKRKVISTKQYDIKCQRVAEYFEQVKISAAKWQYEATEYELQDIVFEHCESDIERLMATAIHAEMIVNGTLTRSFGNHIAPCKPFELDDGTPINFDAWIRRYCNRTYWKQGIFGFLQARIDGYRIDFLVGALSSLDAKPEWAVVECDGHDFHEKTKEQARRDKKRDRHFTAKGYHVFRFTGSEIYHDPGACARQVVDFLTPFTFNPEFGQG